MIRRLVLIVAILWIAGFAEAKNLYWKDLPRYLDKKQVTVTDGQGVTHTGWFIATYADSIVIGNGGRIEIPRGSILSITRHGIRKNHADAFGSHMLDFALSPFAIVTIPVAIVVFIGGLPVCALLDKMDSHPNDLTIKLLPDPK